MKRQILQVFGQNWGGHLGETTKDSSVASESSAAASQASASPPKASTGALLLGSGVGVGFGVWLSSRGVVFVQSGMRLSEGRLVGLALRSFSFERVCKVFVCFPTKSARILRYLSCTGDDQPLVDAAHQAHNGLIACSLHSKRGYLQPPLQFSLSYTKSRPVKQP